MGNLEWDDACLLILGILYIAQSLMNYVTLRLEM